MAVLKGNCVKFGFAVLDVCYKISAICYRETCAHYRNRVMIMYGIEADCDDRLNHRYAGHVTAYFA